MAGIRVKDTVLWGRDYAKIARKQGRAEDEARDLALDGYICISSSETKLTAGTLFHIYRELWRLTEPFQLLESDFSPSPYPVAHAIHMRAHFLCATPHSSPCACFAAIWDGAETPPKLPMRFCAWKAATWPKIGFVQLPKSHNRRNRTGRGR